MAQRSRLDAELVRRGHARSRGHAAEIIADGFVRVAGTVASKAATQVRTDQPIVARAPSAEPSSVSRGARPGHGGAWEPFRRARDRCGWRLRAVGLGLAPQRAWSGERAGQSPRPGP